MVYSCFTLFSCLSRHNLSPNIFYHKSFNLSRRRTVPCLPLSPGEPSPVSCVDSLGVLLKPDYLTQHFEIIIKKNNLKKIRYHDLRHSCASLLLANGVSLKEIQDWLGHLDYSTTANIYSHLEYGAKLKSAGKISETLNIKREKKDGE